MVPDVAASNSSTRAVHVGKRCCGSSFSAVSRIARSQLADFNYTVLKSAIPEHLGYRQAMRTGRSIAETAEDWLNERAQVLLTDLLKTIRANAEKRSRKRPVRRSVEA